MSPGQVAGVVVVVLVLIVLVVLLTIFIMKRRQRTRQSSVMNMGFNSSVSHCNLFSIKAYGLYNIA